jgi:CRISPR-associated protein Cmr5
MRQTLDQQRAQFAWERVTQARRNLREYDNYKNLAKGAPALIMGNGLMPALAFYRSRDKDHATVLMNDILAWLAQRYQVPNAFEKAMAHFFSGDSASYVRATDETLAMLKWLRQFADAVNSGG